MARIKLVYIGGGGTRAAGTMASLIHQGENFAGSEIVLVDLDPEPLEVVRTLAEGMARYRDLDLRFTATTDRRAALRDSTAVLSSFRPGGFAARHLDESIPLQHGVIGQETQGPGGFFMALRAVHVMREIVSDMEELCPAARLFNYTNPVNIVSQGVGRHSAIPIVSLCEGPIIFPRMIAGMADLDRDGVDAQMIGLNHASWSVRHLYRGEDLIPLIRDAWERKRNDPQTSAHRKRMLHLTAMMESIPADYFQYYYFRDELLAELRSRPTTRSQDIMAHTDDYWQHYREQASRNNPELDPQRSRGGIHELELAIDVMDAMYNDRREVWPVNVPNRGAIPDLPSDLVVEVPGFVDRHGVVPLASPTLPDQARGLVEMLAQYQSLAAEAAWCGTRRDAIRALASNPLVLDLTLAEAIYDQMSAAHRDYLPARLAS